MKAGWVSFLLCTSSSCVRSQFRRAKAAIYVPDWHAASTAVYLHSIITARSQCRRIPLGADRKAQLPPSRCPWCSLLEVRKKGACLQGLFEQACRPWTGRRPTAQGTEDILQPSYAQFHSLATWVHSSKLCQNLQSHQLRAIFLIAEQLCRFRLENEAKEGSKVLLATHLSSTEFQFM